jgi:hypothetical protein
MMMEFGLDQFAGATRTNPSPPAISGMNTATLLSVAEGSTKQLSQIDQRENPRYDLTRPAVAVPICADSSPAQSHCADGFSWDASHAGVGFELLGVERLPTNRMLIGLESDDGVPYFATLSVRHVQREAGRLKIGGRFATAEQDLLRPANLTPTFCPETGRFATALKSEVLFQWVELGIFRPVLVDRIFVCPHCGSLPTFRSGCRSCGSIHIASHQLVHHFPCSYLGLVSEFEQGGEIRCPKCQVGELREGEDFEFLSGPCRCLDCNWADSDTVIVGHCLECKEQFQLDGAAEMELIGYHVNRLDPRALVD